MKRKFLIIFFVASFSFISYSIYVRSLLSSIDTLLVCASNEFVPALVTDSICRFHLHRIHDNDDDIQFLNDSIGVSWAIMPEINRYDIELLEVLISKGVDINSIDRNSGITALHAMVFEKGKKGIDILLAYGARPDIPSLKPFKIENNEALTPLDLAIFLHLRDGDSVMESIIEKLEASM